MYNAASSYAMYTTVLSLAASPSLGSRCRNPETRSADRHIGSSSRPSIVGGCAKRTARTCCGATVGGESTGTAGGYTAARSIQNESRVVIEPGCGMDGGPRSRIADGERACYR